MATGENRVGKWGEREIEKESNRLAE